MKRNESILVYGVTGLLVVILLVAVVFGNESSNNATPSGVVGKGGQGKAANQTREETDVGKMIDHNGVDIEGKLVRRDPAAGSQPPTGVESKPSAGQPAPSAPVDAALNAGGNSAEAKVPVALEAAFLLRSTREGEYRKVTVQDGESLSTLMERFGIGQARREEVLRLNEMMPTLDRVRSGQQVILPWVDDAVLIAGEKQRRERETALAAEKRAAKDGPRTNVPLAKPVPQPGPGAPRVGEWAGENGKAPAAKVPVAGGPTKDHKVKRGDSLWKIASECGGNVTHAIEQIRALNPTVDMDPLREGVVLKVPTR